MEKKVFGYELIMDLYDCDLEVMKSKKKLQEYVDKLCPMIDMVKYGKLMLPYFGTQKTAYKGVFAGAIYRNQFNHGSFFRTLAHFLC